MNFDFKDVTVYVDKSNDLFFVPHGIWTVHKVTAEVNNIVELRHPYNTEELQSVIEESFKRCYSQEVDNDFPKVTAIEKHLKIKGYKKAIKNKKVVNLHWDEEGYQVTPTTYSDKKGYVHQEGNTFFLGKELNESSLAEALLKAIRLSEN
ncbi:MULTISPECIES: hypothetical protein [unclassified Paenibacillus]|uniref:hypothetical protein n=1 Tax=unclassified Paenibacillus TaxID=185978 RepID=UPI002406B112|nr:MULTISPECIES: hypothetical protein [unclassified Paenibacillus]MDF9845556.1 hypothetical protein [Paenibacillus sp. PastF-2]MDF9852128.1 hypothetical protein [Paenibacillus sp. PastM-2]MDF9858641.1 hypothetical protein [Paenibacillus sp. PastF-1]MDH6483965.1 hypothetical protein [Paenibacillus sp. PastH-2]MDH6511343.1 hypothetical protein [Paenibacillus sp. PastM-3]